MATMLASRLRLSIPARPIVSLRGYSAVTPPPPPKVPIALISQLRKINPVPMTKAKEALQKSGLVLEDALAWLEADLAQGGAAKQRKVASRIASEGLIAVGCMGEGWGKRGGIVELNCETSFVYRTPGFISLLEGIRHTNSFFHTPHTIASADESPSHLVHLNPEEVMAAPLIPDPSADSTLPSSSSTDATTIAQQITALVSTTGEKITLRRAAVFAPPTSEEHIGLFYPAYFAHTPSGIPKDLGSVACFLVLHLTGEATAKPSKELLKDVEVLGRSLARQMVGIPCTHVYSFKGGDGLEGVVPESDVLMEQHFMFFSGPEGGMDKSVGQVLGEWGKNRGVHVRVEGAERWTVGEGGEEVDELES